MIEQPDAEPRPTPDVPNDADVDVPPDGPPVELVETKDADARQRRKFAAVRLTFAITLVCVCLGLVVLLTVLQWLFQEYDVTGLSSTIDWLKVVTATALGYVLGRSVGSTKEDAKDG